MSSNVLNSQEENKSNSKPNSERGEPLPQIGNFSPVQNGVYKTKHKKFPRTYINILHDPRVVKGNTYAAFVIPSSLQLEFLRLKEEEERRKMMGKPSTKLPRVAFLSKNKVNKLNKRETDEEDKNEVVYNEIEPEEVEDEPYFYIDKSVKNLIFKYLSQPLNMSHLPQDEKKAHRLKIWNYLILN